MRGEIIAIGDELVNGRINNTTSGYAARHLYAAGHTIRSIHTIGDTPELIGSAIRHSLAHADFVIITGGLGSTTDDLTNQAVIDALQLNGALHSQVVEGIEKRHKKLSMHQRAAVEKLAWLPEKATILDEGYQMAGYLLSHAGKPLFFLPGIPSQMEHLLTTKVLPVLQDWFPHHSGCIRQELYRIFGLYENEVNRRLLTLERSEGVQIGYYPVGCEVHVSLTVQAEDEASCDARFSTTDQAIRESLGSALFGVGEISMAEAVGNLMLNSGKGRMLCVAESCTGGLIGSKLTQVAGSSRWFAGGVVAYSNALKEELLRVDSNLLNNYGAVSSQAARAMAARLAARLHCSTAVSVTGIAGPGGGSKEKPVGTVYIGLFHDNRVDDQRYQFTGTRTHIQELTAYTAIDTVRRALLEG